MSPLSIVGNAESACGRLFKREAKLKPLFKLESSILEPPMRGMYM